MTYPNRVTHSYTYDTRDRVLTLNGYTQTYSPSGRKLSVTEASGRAANYGYDSIYRLLNETISGDSASTNNGAVTYTLDPVGNRQSLTSTLAALQARTSTYDANDRIASDTFDANGNTTASGGVTYSYDFEDRLLSTSNGVQIVYDGDGNRVSETAGGVTTKFLVDNRTPTGYAQVAEEIVNGSVVAQYTYGKMRISQSRSGTVSYYGYDGDGSVRQLLNQAGLVTDTYTFDAFGNTVARTGTTVNSYQYRGEQFDTSLGMYYLRARYFVSRTGRFLQRDQFEGLSYVPKTMNAYVYGLGNPVLYWDPTGLAAEAPITVGLSAATLGLAPEIEVAGTLTVQNGVGLATIENIQAVGKGFSVLRQITSLAIELGAEDLWIQGVLANEGFGVLGSAAGRFGISAIVESGPYTLLRIVIP